MKELKSFLSRVNCKIATAKLLEHFNEVDVRQRGELRFDDFLRLYQKLLVANTVCEIHSMPSLRSKRLPFQLVSARVSRVFKKLSTVHFHIQKTIKLCH